MEGQDDAFLPNRLIVQVGIWTVFGSMVAFISLGFATIDKGSLMTSYPELFVQAFLKYLFFGSLAALLVCVLALPLMVPVGRIVLRMLIRSGLSLMVAAPVAASLTAILTMVLVFAVTGGLNHQSEVWNFWTLFGPPPILAPIITTLLLATRRPGVLE